LPKIAVVVGSTREGSFNRALGRLAIRALEAQGAEVTDVGDEGLVALVAYRGKAAAIMSASVSPFGGLRGLIHLRQILSTVQALVIPEQVLIPNAHAAFDESGALKDALPASLVDMTAMRLAKVAAALAA